MVLLQLCIELMTELIVCLLTTIVGEVLKTGKQVLERCLSAWYSGPCHSESGGVQSWVKSEGVGNDLLRLLGELDTGRRNHVNDYSIAYEGL